MYKVQKNYEEINNFKWCVKKIFLDDVVVFNSTK